MLRGKRTIGKLIHEVGWATNELGNVEKGNRYFIHIGHANIEITESFARKINNADMGDNLMGRTKKGKMIRVRIGTRYY